MEPYYYSSSYKSSNPTTEQSDASYYIRVGKATFEDTKRFTENLEPGSLLASEFALQPNPNTDFVPGVKQVLKVIPWGKEIVEWSIGGATTLLGLNAYSLYNKVGGRVVHDTVFSDKDSTRRQYRAFGNLEYIPYDGNEGRSDKDPTLLHSKGVAAKLKNSQRKVARMDTGPKTTLAMGKHDLYLETSHPEMTAEFEEHLEQLASNKRTSYRGKYVKSGVHIAKDLEADIRASTGSVHISTADINLTPGENTSPEIINAYASMLNALSEKALSNKQNGGTNLYTIDVEKPNSRRALRPFLEEKGIHLVKGQGKGNPHENMALIENIDEEGTDAVWLITRRGTGADTEENAWRVTSKEAPGLFEHLHSQYINEGVKLGISKQTKELILSAHADNVYRKGLFGRIYKPDIRQFSSSGSQYLGKYETGSIYLPTRLSDDYFTKLGGAPISLYQDYYYMMTGDKDPNKVTKHILKTADKQLGPSYLELRGLGHIFNKHFGKDLYVEGGGPISAISKGLGRLLDTLTGHYAMQDIKKMSRRPPRGDIKSLHKQQYEGDPNRGFFENLMGNLSTMASETSNALIFYFGFSHGISLAKAHVESVGLTSILNAINDQDPNKGLLSKGVHRFYFDRFFSDQYYNLFKEIQAINPSQGFSTNLIKYFDDIAAAASTATDASPLSSTTRIQGQMLTRLKDYMDASGVTDVNQAMLEVFGYDKSAGLLSMDKAGLYGEPRQLLDGHIGSVSRFRRMDASNLSNIIIPILEHMAVIPAGQVNNGVEVGQAFRSAVEDLLNVAVRPPELRFLEDGEPTAARFVNFGRERLERIAKSLDTISNFIHRNPLFYMPTVRALFGVKSLQVNDPVTGDTVDYSLRGLLGPGFEGLVRRTDVVLRTLNNLKTRNIQAFTNAAEIATLERSIARRESRLLRILQSGNYAIQNIEQPLKDIQLMSARQNALMGISNSSPTELYKGVSNAARLRRSAAVIGGIYFADRLIGNLAFSNTGLDFITQLSLSKHGSRHKDYTAANGASPEEEEYMRNQQFFQTKFTGVVPSYVKYPALLGGGYLGGRVFYATSGGVRFDSYADSIDTHISSLEKKLSNKQTVNNKLKTYISEQDTSNRKLLHLQTAYDNRVSVIEDLTEQLESYKDITRRVKAGRTGARFSAAGMFIGAVGATFVTQMGFNLAATVANIGAAHKPAPEMGDSIVASVIIGRSIREYLDGVRGAIANKDNREEKDVSYDEAFKAVGREQAVDLTVAGILAERLAQPDGRPGQLINTFAHQLPNPIFQLTLVSKVDESNNRVSIGAGYQFLPILGMGSIPHLPFDLRIREMRIPQVEFIKENYEGPKAEVGTANFLIPNKESTFMSALTFAGTYAYASSITGMLRNRVMPNRPDISKMSAKNKDLYTFYNWAGGVGELADKIVRYSQAPLLMMPDQVSKQFQALIGKGQPIMQTNKRLGGFFRGFGAVSLPLLVSHAYTSRGPGPFDYLGTGYEARHSKDNFDKGFLLGQTYRFGAMMGLTLSYGSAFLFGGVFDSAESMYRHANKSRFSLGLSGEKHEMFGIYEDFFRAKSEMVKGLNLQKNDIGYVYKTVLNNLSLIDTQTDVDSEKPDSPASKTRHVDDLIEGITRSSKISDTLLEQNLRLAGLIDDTNMSAYEIQKLVKSFRRDIDNVRVLAQPKMPYTTPLRFRMMGKAFVGVSAFLAIGGSFLAPSGYLDETDETWVGALFRGLFTAPFRMLSGAASTKEVYDPDIQRYRKQVGVTATQYGVRYEDSWGHMASRLAKGPESFLDFFNISSIYRDNPNEFVNVYGPIGLSKGSQGFKGYIQAQGLAFDFSGSQYSMSRNFLSKDFAYMLSEIFKAKGGSPSELLAAFRGATPRKTPMKVIGSGSASERRAASTFSPAGKRALSVRNYLAQGLTVQRGQELALDVLKEYVRTGRIKARIGDVEGPDTFLKHSLYDIPGQFMQFGSGERSLNIVQGIKQTWDRLGNFMATGSFEDAPVDFTGVINRSITTRKPPSPILGFFNENWGRAFDTMEVNPLLGVGYISAMGVLSIATGASAIFGLTMGMAALATWKEGGDLSMKLDTLAERTTQMANRPITVISVNVQGEDKLAVVSSQSGRKGGTIIDSVGPTKFTPESLSKQFNTANRRLAALLSEDISGNVYIDADGKAKTVYNLREGLQNLQTRSFTGPDRKSRIFQASEEVLKNYKASVEEIFDSLAQSFNIFDTDEYRIFKGNSQLEGVFTNLIDDLNTTIAHRIRATGQLTDIDIVNILNLASSKIIGLQQSFINILGTYDSELDIEDIPDVVTRKRVTAQQAAVKRAYAREVRARQKAATGLRARNVAEMASDVGYGGLAAGGFRGAMDLFSSVIDVAQIWYPLGSSLTSLGAENKAERRLNATAAGGLLTEGLYAAPIIIGGKFLLANPYVLLGGGALLLGAGLADHYFNQGRGRKYISKQIERMGMWSEKNIEKPLGDVLYNLSSAAPPPVRSVLRALNKPFQGIDEVLNKMHSNVRGTPWQYVAAFVLPDTKENWIENRAASTRPQRTYQGQLMYERSPSEVEDYWKNKLQRRLYRALAISSQISVDYELVHPFLVGQTSGYREDHLYDLYFDGKGYAERVLDPFAPKMYMSHLLIMAAQRRNTMGDALHAKAYNSIYTPKFTKGSPQPSPIITQTTAYARNLRQNNRHFGDHVAEVTQAARGAANGTRNLTSPSWWTEQYRSRAQARTNFSSALEADPILRSYQSVDDYLDDSFFTDASEIHNRRELVDRYDLRNAYKYSKGFINRTILAVGDIVKPIVKPFRPSKWVNRYRRVSQARSNISSAIEADNILRTYQSVDDYLDDGSLLFSDDDAAEELAKRQELVDRYDLRNAYRDSRGFINRTILGLGDFAKGVRNSFNKLKSALDVVGKLTSKYRTASAARGKIQNAIVEINKELLSNESYLDDEIKTIKQLREYLTNNIVEDEFSDLYEQRQSKIDDIKARYGLEEVFEQATGFKNRTVLFLGDAAKGIRSVINPFNWVDAIAHPKRSFIRMTKGKQAAADFQLEQLKQIGAIEPPVSVWRGPGRFLLRGGVMGTILYFPFKSGLDTLFPDRAEEKNARDAFYTSYGLSATYSAIREATTANARRIERAVTAGDPVPQELIQSAEALEESTEATRDTLNESNPTRGSFWQRLRNVFRRRKPQQTSSSTTFHELDINFLNDTPSTRKPFFQALRDFIFGERLTLPSEAEDGIETLDSTSEVKPASGIDINFLNDRSQTRNRRSFSLRRQLSRLYGGVRRNIGYGLVTGLDVFSSVLAFHQAKSLDVEHARRSEYDIVAKSTVKNTMNIALSVLLSGVFKLNVGNMMSILTTTNATVGEESGEMLGGYMYDDDQNERRKKIDNVANIGLGIAGGLIGADIAWRSFGRLNPKIRPQVANIRGVPVGNILGPTAAVASIGTYLYSGTTQSKDYTGIRQAIQRRRARATSRGQIVGGLEMLSPNKLFQVGGFARTVITPFVPSSRDIESRMTTRGALNLENLKQLADEEAKGGISGAIAGGTAATLFASRSKMPWYMKAGLVLYGAGVGMFKGEDIAAELFLQRKGEAEGDNPFWNIASIAGGFLMDLGIRTFFWNKGWESLKNIRPHRNPRARHAEVTFESRMGPGDNGLGDSGGGGDSPRPPTPSSGPSTASSTSSSSGSSTIKLEETINPTDQGIAQLSRDIQWNRAELANPSANIDRGMVQSHMQVREQALSESASQLYQNIDNEKLLEKQNWYEGEMQSDDYRNNPARRIEIDAHLTAIQSIQESRLNLPTTPPVNTSTDNQSFETNVDSGNTAPSLNETVTEQSTRSSVNQPEVYSKEHWDAFDKSSSDLPDMPLYNPRKDGFFTRFKAGLNSFLGIDDYDDGFIRFSRRQPGEKVSIGQRLLNAYMSDFKRSLRATVDSFTSRIREGFRNAISRPGRRVARAFSGRVSRVLSNLKNVFSGIDQVSPSQPIAPDEAYSVWKRFRSNMGKEFSLGNQFRSNLVGVALYGNILTGVEDALKGRSAKQMLINQGWAAVAGGMLSLASVGLSTLAGSSSTGLSTTGVLGLTALATYATYSLIDQTFNVAGMAAEKVMGRDLSARETFGLQMVGKGVAIGTAAKVGLNTFRYQAAASPTLSRMRIATPPSIPTAAPTRAGVGPLGKIANAARGITGIRSFSNALKGASKLGPWFAVALETAFGIFDTYEANKQMQAARAAGNKDAEFEAGALRARAIGTTKGRIGGGFIGAKLSAIAVGTLSLPSGPGAAVTGTAAYFAGGYAGAEAAGHILGNIYEVAYRLSNRPIETIQGAASNVREAFSKENRLKTVGELFRRLSPVGAWIYDRVMTPPSQPTTTTTQTSGGGHAARQRRTKTQLKPSNQGVRRQLTPPTQGSQSGVSYQQSHSSNPQNWAYTVASNIPVLDLFFPKGAYAQQSTTITLPTEEEYRNFVIPKQSTEMPSTPADISSPSTPAEILSPPPPSTPADILSPLPIEKTRDDYPGGALPTTSAKEEDYMEPRGVLGILLSRGLHLEQKLYNYVYRRTLSKIEKNKWRSGDSVQSQVTTYTKTRKAFGYHSSLSKVVSLPKVVIYTTDEVVNRYGPEFRNALGWFDSYHNEVGYIKSQPMSKIKNVIHHEMTHFRNALIYSTRNNDARLTLNTEHYLKTLISDFKLINRLARIEDVDERWFNFRRAVGSAEVADADNTLRSDLSRRLLDEMSAYAEDELHEQTVKKSGNFFKRSIGYLRSRSGSGSTQKTKGSLTIQDQTTLDFYERLLDERVNIAHDIYGPADARALEIKERAARIEGTPRKRLENGLKGRAFKAFTRSLKNEFATPKGLKGQLGAGPLAFVSTAIGAVEDMYVDNQGVGGALKNIAIGVGVGALATVGLLAVGAVSAKAALVVGGALAVVGILSSAYSLGRIGVKAFNDLTGRSSKETSQSSIPRNKNIEPMANRDNSMYSFMGNLPVLDLFFPSASLATEIPQDEKEKVFSAYIQRKERQEAKGFESQYLTYLSRSIEYFEDYNANKYDPFNALKFMGKAMWWGFTTFTPLGASIKGVYSLFKESVELGKSLGNWIKAGGPTTSYQGAKKNVQQWWKRITSAVSQTFGITTNIPSNYNYPPQGFVPSQAPKQEGLRAPGGYGPPVSQTTTPTTAPSSPSFTVRSSGAFATGLFTGPRGQIGRGTEWHIDTKISKSIGAEAAVALIDNMARGYASIGREMIFINAPLANKYRRWDVNAPLAEKIKQLNAIDRAHSKVSSNNPGLYDLDYNSVLIGKGMHHSSRERAEIILPIISGGSYTYDTSNSYGNAIRIRDAAGRRVMSTGHGDRRIPLPPAGRMPDLPSNNQSSVPIPEPKSRTVASNQIRRFNFKTPTTDYLVASADLSFGGPLPSYTTAQATTSQSSIGSYEYNQFYPSMVLETNLLEPIYIKALDFTEGLINSPYRDIVRLLGKVTEISAVSKGPQGEITQHSPKILSPVDAVIGDIISTGYEGSYSISLLNKQKELIAILSNMYSPNLRVGQEIKVGDDLGYAGTRNPALSEDNFAPLEVYASESLTYKIINTLVTGSPDGTVRSSNPISESALSTENRSIARRAGKGRSNMYNGKPVGPNHVAEIVDYDIVDSALIYPAAGTKFRIGTGAEGYSYLYTPYLGNKETKQISLTAPLVLPVDVNVTNIQQYQGGYGLTLSDLQGRPLATIFNLVSSDRQPFNTKLQVGETVKAGTVIGYQGVVSGLNNNTVELLSIEIYANDPELFKKLEELYRTKELSQEMPFMSMGQGVMDYFNNMVEGGINLRQRMMNSMTDIKEGMRSRLVRDPNDIKEGMQKRILGYTVSEYESNSVSSTDVNPTSSSIPSQRSSSGGVEDIVPLGLGGVINTYPSSIPAPGTSTTPIESFDPSRLGIELEPLSYTPNRGTQEMSVDWVNEDFYAVKEAERLKERLAQSKKESYEADVATILKASRTTSRLPIPFAKAIAEAKLLRPSMIQSKLQEAKRRTIRQVAVAPPTGYFSGDANYEVADKHNRKASISQDNESHRVAYVTEDNERDKTKIRIDYEEGLGSNYELEIDYEFAAMVPQMQSSSNERVGGTDWFGVPV